MAKKFKSKCFVCGAKESPMWLSAGMREYCEPCSKAYMDYEMRKQDIWLYKLLKEWEKEKNYKTRKAIMDYFGKKYGKVGA